MSLCYDFSKLTMISLTSVAISLSVGLILQYTHGYTDPAPYNKDPEIQAAIDKGLAVNILYATDR